MFGKDEAEYIEICMQGDTTYEKGWQSQVLWGLQAIEPTD
jgi:hypothetical protein